MELEEAIRMAREAGALIENWMTNPPKPGLFYLKPEQLLALANAIEAQAAAKEREAIMDEWAMCMSSDLEHGVKSLNQRAAELWAMTYPQMAGFAAAIEKRGATDGKPT